MSLKAELINSSLHRPEVASDDMKKPTFPVKYTKVEIQGSLDIDAKQRSADIQMPKFRDYLGIILRDGFLLGCMTRRSRKPTA
jgi:hypothetical protein